MKGKPASNEGCPPYSNIIVSPQALTFTYEEGAIYSPPYQHITVSYDPPNGPRPSWDVTVDKSWVRYSAGKVSVRVGLKVGTHTAQITISSPNGVQILPSPNVAVTLEVTPKPTPPPPPKPRYKLTVESTPEEGGVAVDMTSGSPYLEGDKVSIKAEPNEGYEFAGWTAAAGTFEDATAAQTVFTMPPGEMTVSATFGLLPTPTPPAPWYKKLIDIITKIIHVIFGMSEHG
jgi:hypothetical protein